MEQQIKWETGKPTNSGFYLTTRESKLGGRARRYVSENFWRADIEKWEARLEDRGKIIAFTSMDNIKPY